MSFPHNGNGLSRFVAQSIYAAETQGCFGNGAAVYDTPYGMAYPSMSIWGTNPQFNAWMEYQMGRAGVHSQFGGAMQDPLYSMENGYSPFAATHATSGIDYVRDKLNQSMTTEQRRLTVQDLQFQYAYEKQHGHPYEGVSETHINLVRSLSPEQNGMIGKIQGHEIGERLRAAQNDGEEHTQSAANPVTPLVTATTYARPQKSSAPKMG